MTTTATAKPAETTERATARAMTVVFESLGSSSSSDFDGSATERLSMITQKHNYLINTISTAFLYVKGDAAKLTTHVSRKMIV